MSWPRPSKPSPPTAPRSTRGDLMQLLTDDGARGAGRGARGAGRLSLFGCIPILPPMKRRFNTIVIDPPWPGPNASPSYKCGKGSIPIPYSTMTGIQLAALRIDELAAPSAQLFLWVTSRSMQEAGLLMELWGFSYAALFVWDKRALGLGRHVRHQCEFVLWGRRPGAPLVQSKQCPRQIQTWPKPRRHSEKPAEAYDLFRRLGAAPRLDMFARQNRPGFIPFGNQIGKLDGSAT
jgi:N6-adenosine-specific RNA methylase IME4